LPIPEVYTMRAMSSGAMWRALGVTISLVLAGCTGTNGDPESSVQSPPAVSSPSPSPTKAPEPPKVSEARLEGLYNVRFVVTSTTFGGGPSNHEGRWVFEPKCSGDRPCNTKMESRTGEYDVTLAYVNGKYRGGGE
jgi:hypothetical protein